MIWEIINIIILVYLFFWIMYLTQLCGGDTVYFLGIPLHDCGKCKENCSDKEKGK